MSFYQSVSVILCVVVASAASAVDVKDEPWQELRDCQLIPHEANDGDSFHVKHRDEHYIFRLCFVDAPETSRSIPHRITEQAVWWSLSEDDVVVYGEAAKVFSLAFLKDGFTVHTQYKDARGKSALKRNFAMVEVDGTFLSEALVREGLGRAYGYLPDLPDGSSRWEFRKRLQTLEKKAKKARKGAWRSSSERGEAKRNPMPGEDGEPLPSGKTITLTAPVAIYAAGASSHFLGTLKSGTEVFVLDQTPGVMMKVRAPYHGKYG